jgi:hypothetical protein
MKMKSILTKTFWTIWVMISLLLIAALTTNIKITNGLINNGLVYIFIFGLVKMVVAKRSWALAKKLVASTAVFGLFLSFQFYTDWSWRGDWKTQTILYQNKHLFNRTIEFQLQDKGALGFNKRTVDRIKIIPFVSWTKKLTDENLKNVDSLTWDKANIDLNEQGLKGG